ncbi:hypothetical protein KAM621c_37770 [Citrobacter braakii]|uniref:Class II glutamine amidotransferase n=1 Tax=Citrobacter braakii TaxID=57706 RepID=A0AAD1L7K7_CITBR|nr:hypothetical protein KAM621c_37770 [Citrobacter braakii]
MCELLGMSANVPTDICFSFTGLVQRGGGTGPHKDGWGITFYEGKGCRTFKDPQPSFNSPIQTGTRLSHQILFRDCPYSSGESWRSGIGKYPSIYA